MPRNKKNPQKGLTFILPCDQEYGLPGEVPPGTRGWVADDVWEPIEEIPIRLRSGRFGIVYYVPKTHVQIDTENTLERSRRLDRVRSKAYKRRPEVRARDNARARSAEAKAHARALQWAKSTVKNPKKRAMQAEQRVRATKPQNRDEFIAAGGVVETTKQTQAPPTNTVNPRRKPY